MLTLDAPTSITASTTSTNYGLTFNLSGGDTNLAGTDKVWKLYTDSSYTNLQAEGTTTSSSITVNGLAAYSTYYFKVYLMASGYNSSSHATKSATTAAEQLPSANIVGTTPWSPTSIQFEVSPYNINDSSAILKYQVSTNSSFTSIVTNVSVLRSAVDTSGGKIITTGLNAVTTYYFRAYWDAQTTGYANGSYGTTASATTPNYDAPTPNITSISPVGISDLSTVDVVTLTVDNWANTSYTLEVSATCPDLNETITTEVSRSASSASSYTVDFNWFEEFGGLDVTVKARAVKSGYTTSSWSNQVSGSVPLGAAPSPVLTTAPAGVYDTIEVAYLNVPNHGRATSELKWGIAGSDFNNSVNRLQYIPPTTIEGSEWVIYNNSSTRSYPSEGWVRFYGSSTVEEWIYKEIYFDRPGTITMDFLASDGWGYLRGVHKDAGYTVSNVVSHSSFPSVPSASRFDIGYAVNGSSSNYGAIGGYYNSRSFYIPTAGTWIFGMGENTGNRSMQFGNFTWRYSDEIVLTGGHSGQTVDGMNFTDTSVEVTGLSASLNPWYFAQRYLITRGTTEYSFAWGGSSLALSNAQPSPYVQINDIYEDANYWYADWEFYTSVQADVDLQRLGTDPANPWVSLKRANTTGFWSSATNESSGRTSLSSTAGGIYRVYNQATGQASADFVVDNGDIQGTTHAAPDISLNQALSSEISVEIPLDFESHVDNSDNGGNSDAGYLLDYYNETTNTWDYSLDGTEDPVQTGSKQAFGQSFFYHYGRNNNTDAQLEGTSHLNGNGPTVPGSSAVYGWQSGDRRATLQIQVSTSSTFATILKTVNTAKLHSLEQRNQTGLDDDNIENDYPVVQKITGLTAGTTYYVRAKWISGRSAYADSAWSAGVQMTTAPAVGALSIDNAWLYTADGTTYNPRFSVSGQVGESTSFAVMQKTYCMSGMWGLRPVGWLEWGDDFRATPYQTVGGAFRINMFPPTHEGVLAGAYKSYDDQWRGGKMLFGEDSTSGGNVYNNRGYHPYDDGTSTIGGNTGMYNPAINIEVGRRFIAVMHIEDPNYDVPAEQKYLTIHVNSSPYQSSSAPGGVYTGDLGAFYWDPENLPYDTNSHYGRAYSLNSRGRAGNVLTFNSDEARDATGNLYTYKTSTTTHSYKFNHVRFDPKWGIPSSLQGTLTESTAWKQQYYIYDLFDWIGAQYYFATEDYQSTTSEYRITESNPSGYNYTWSGASDSFPAYTLPWLHSMNTSRRYPQRKGAQTREGVPVKSQSAYWWYPVYVQTPNWRWQDTTSAAVYNEEFIDLSPDEAVHFFDGAEYKIQSNPAWRTAPAPAKIDSEQKIYRFNSTPSTARVPTFDSGYAGKVRDNNAFGSSKLIDGSYRDEFLANNIESNTFIK